METNLYPHTQLEPQPESSFPFLSPLPSRVLFSCLSLSLFHRTGSPAVLPSCVHNAVHSWESLITHPQLTPPTPPIQ